MIEQNLKIELIHSGGIVHEGYEALGFYAMPLLHKWPAPVLAESGEYRWSLYNKAGELIASAGFTPLFSEWQRSLPRDAEDSQNHFREVLIVPHSPEGQVIIERRGSFPPWNKVAVITIAKDLDVMTLPRGVQVHKLHEGTVPAKALNICFVSEGYGYTHQDLFLADAKRASDLLLKSDPFTAHAGRINTFAFLKAVRQNGVPLSAVEDTTETNFDTSYTGLLGKADYIAVRDTHALHEAIGTEVCDAIVVLCESETPGGSGLYNQHTALPGRLDDAELGPLLLNYVKQLLSDKPEDLAVELASRLG